MSGEDDDNEWRFGLDEVGEDAEDDGGLFGGGGRQSRSDGNDGNVVGLDPESSNREQIEPGDVDLENALFVLLGAVVTVLIFYNLYQLAT
jgi:hypothetical protein